MSSRLPEAIRGPATHWDRAIALAALVFLLLDAYGPVRLHENRALLDITATRALVLLIVLVVVRHVRYPRPWLGATLAARVRARLLPEGSRFVLTTGLASRLAVAAIGLAVAIAHPPGPGELSVSAKPFWNFTSRWDAYWYLDIAARGYRWNPDAPDQQWNVAFFPAFPVAMRTAGHAISMPLRWTGRDSYSGETWDARLHLAGWLVSVAAFVWALSVMFELARSDLGPARARWAVALLAYFPFALFFSLPYTESVFLLTVTSALLAARRDRPMAMLVWGALAALTRQTAVLLVVPLALVALAPLWPRWLGGANGPVSRSFRLPMLLAALGPLLGLGIHLAHLSSAVGDPFAWVKAQQGWQHTDQALLFVMERWEGLSREGVWGYLQSQPGRFAGTVVPLMALALLWRTWRLSPAYAAFVVVTLAPALVVATPSIGRIGAPLFPLFIALASVLPSRLVGWLVLGAFGGLQLWGAWLFFSWRPFF